MFYPNFNFKEHSQWGTYLMESEVPEIIMLLNEQRKVNTNLYREKVNKAEDSKQQWAVQCIGGQQTFQVAASSK